MDVSTRALALRATDYKENDKYILLYSLEYGKISVLARGIRKAQAKLKFCADQFCFGNYELAKTDDRFTLKTCEQLESFFSLRQDVVVYYSACVIAECLANYTEQGQSDSDTFVETLKALQCLTEKTNPLLVVVRFLLKFLQLQGFGLFFNGCVNCGKSTKQMFLDLQRGGIVCDLCHNLDNVVISPKSFSTCKLIENMPYDKLRNINVTTDALKDILSFINKYVSHSFYPMHSLPELILLA